MNDLTFTPNGGALALASTDYQTFVWQFKRATDRVQSNTKPTVEPDLNIKDAQARRNVAAFLRWTQQFSQVQWKEGLPLNKAAIQEACGQPAHVGYTALRQCLVKVKSGNRKLGEPDVWTLSAPHCRGLAMFLARCAALDAALAAREIEELERRVQAESELEALLAEPQQSQFELDQEWAERQRLQALKVPLEHRVKAHGIPELRITVGQRDDAPYEEPSGPSAESKERQRYLKQGHL